MMQLLQRAPVHGPLTDYCACGNPHAYCRRHHAGGDGVYGARGYCCCYYCCCWCYCRRHYCCHHYCYYGCDATVCADAAGCGSDAFGAASHPYAAAAYDHRRCRCCCCCCRCRCCQHSRSGHDGGGGGATADGAGDRVSQARRRPLDAPHHHRHQQGRCWQQQRQAAWQHYRYCRAPRPLPAAGSHAPPPCQTRAPCAQQQPLAPAAAAGCHPPPLLASALGTACSHAAPPPSWQQLPAATAPL